MPMLPQLLMPGPALGLGGLGKHRGLAILSNGPEARSAGCLAFLQFGARQPGGARPAEISGAVRVQQFEETIGFPPAQHNTAIPELGIQDSVVSSHVQRGMPKGRPRTEIGTYRVQKLSQQEGCWFVKFLMRIFKSIGTG